MVIWLARIGKEVQTALLEAENLPSFLLFSTPLLMLAVCKRFRSEQLLNSSHLHAELHL